MAVGSARTLAVKAVDDDVGFEFLNSGFGRKIGIFRVDQRKRTDTQRPI